MTANHDDLDHDGAPAADLQRCPRCSAGWTADGGPCMRCTMRARDTEPPDVAQRDDEPRPPEPDRLADEPGRP